MISAVAVIVVTLAVEDDDDIRNEGRLRRLEDWLSTVSISAH